MSEPTPIKWTDDLTALSPADAFIDADGSSVALQVGLNGPRHTAHGGNVFVFIKDVFDDEVGMALTPDQARQVVDRLTAVLNDIDARAGVSS